MRHATSSSEKENRWHLFSILSSLIFFSSLVPCSIIGMCQAAVYVYSLGGLKHDHHLSHTNLFSFSYAWQSEREKNESRRKEREEKKEREKNERKRGKAFIHLFIDFIDKDYKQQQPIIIIIKKKKRKHVFHYCDKCLFKTGLFTTIE